MQNENIMLKCYFDPVQFMYLHKKNLLRDFFVVIEEYLCYVPINSMQLSLVFMYVQTTNVNSNKSLKVKNRRVVFILIIEES